MSNLGTIIYVTLYAQYCSSVTFALTLYVPMLVHKGDSQIPICRKYVEFAFHKVAAFAGSDKVAAVSSDLW